MKKVLSLTLALIMMLSIFTAVSFAASAPAKVTGVKVTSIKADSAKVSWKAVSKASGYIIYKFIKSSNKYVKLATVTGTAKTIKDLKESTKYMVCVSAYKKASGKMTIGKKSEIVSFTTKSESFATQKLFYNYIRKNFTLATSSGFPTKAKSGALVSVKIFDIDGDGKLEMVTFAVTRDNKNANMETMSVSYYEIKNEKVTLINSLKNLYNLVGVGVWEAFGCAFIKGNKILISSDIMSFGGSVCVSNRRVLAVKSGKLKMTKDYHYYFSRGHEGFFEEVSGKEFNGFDDLEKAWGKAGFKKHEHKYNKSSDISSSHIYAYYSNGSDTQTNCTLFVDKTNLKSHMK